MNQEFVILKTADKEAQLSTPTFIVKFEGEKKDALQSAARYVETIDDGTYVVAMLLGGPLVAATKRVVSGVAQTRAKAPANGKPAAKKTTKPRGLNPALKTAKGADDAAGA